MISKQQYDAIWRKYFVDLPSLSFKPEYFGYVNREVLFQDYLDLFRGYNTYTRVKNPYLLHCQEEYVCIDIDGESIYYHVGKNAFLGHFGKQREIKHILISGLEYSLIDLFSPYIDEAITEPYFKEIFKAFHIPYRTSVKNLIRLADLGILPALDIFPFDPIVIPKSTRDVMIISNKIDELWQSKENILSIVARIEELSASNILSSTTTIGLMTGAYLSEIISNKVESKILKIPCPGQCVINAYKNVFLPSSDEKVRNMNGYLIWKPGEILNSLFKNPTLFDLETPYYRSSCYNSSKLPDELFIKNALTR